MNKSNKNKAIYAGAAGITLLATMVGAGVYLWQKRQAGKKVDFKKVRISILNDIKRSGRQMSSQVKKLSDGK